MNLNGNAGDLLRTLNSADDSADPNKTSLGGKKVKSGDAALVFNAVETLLIFLAGEEASERKALALDVTRKILQKHTRYILMLLSPTNTAYQARASLKLLASMVACGQPTAKEVLIKIDLEHKNFDAAMKRRRNDATDPMDDVRTVSYTHLTLPTTPYV